MCAYTWRVLQGGQAGVCVLEQLPPTVAAGRLHPTTATTATTTATATAHAVRRHRRLDGWWHLLRLSMAHVPPHLFAPRIDTPPVRHIYPWIATATQG